MSKARIYRLYLTRRGDRITNQSRRFPYSHPWMAERAVSIRQAYYLVGNEVWASDDGAVGLRTIETDWWHRRGVPLPEDRIVAPYLTSDGEAAWADS